MENYMMIDCVKIPLTNDQVKMMRSAPSKQSPFMRTREDGIYYGISRLGKIIASREENRLLDGENYEIANYCTDKDLMSQRALHETLNRLLWRFSLENGEGEYLWARQNYHWYIMRDMRYNEIRSFCTCWEKLQGTIYFPSKEIAFRAIEEIVKPFIKTHPDFVW